VGGGKARIVMCALESDGRLVPLSWVRHDDEVGMSTRILAIFALPALAVFVLFIILGFLWRPFLLFALPVAALVVWFMWQRSDQAILSKLGARGLGEREGERIRNTVENLCLTSGIDQPEIFAIDTPACNVVSISGRNDALVVTTGLLESLDVLEMEGVVAHALAKLSTGTLRYETLAASAQPFITGAQQDMARRWGPGDGSVVAFDIIGVGLTRYPPGLRSALERIDGRSTEIDGASSLGAALLIPPVEQRVPIDHRIEVLWEL